MLYLARQSDFVAGQQLKLAMEPRAVEGVEHDLDRLGIPQLPGKDQVKSFRGQRDEVQTESSGGCPAAYATIRMARVNLPGGRQVAPNDRVIAADASRRKTELSKPGIE